nr:hypothetical protein HmN_000057900 [Hymenolepis microstoma]
METMLFYKYLPRQMEPEFRGNSLSRLKLEPVTQSACNQCLHLMDLLINAICTCVQSVTSTSSLTPQMMARRCSKVFQECLYLHYHTQAKLTLMSDALPKLPGSLTAQPRVGKELERLYQKAF